MSDKCDFSDSIQKKIAAMLLSDKASFQDNADIIRPEMFDNPAVSDVVALVYAFHMKYHRLPEVDELTTEFELFLQTKKNIPVDEHLTVYGEVIDLIGETDFSYVKDKVVEFARYQAIRAAIADSADIVRKKKNYAEILEKIRSALSIGDSSKDLGALYFEELEQRLERRRNGITRAELAIRTGIDSFDNILGGGLGPGELGIIMGPMKRGKTILSVNMGAGATVDGHNVAHYVMESSEERILSSYDSHISGVTKSNLKANEEVVREYVQNWHSNPNNGRLVIKHMPSQTCSALVIENHLARMKARENFVPKLIIIDYLGLMVGNEKWALKTGDRYFLLGQICKELLSLAQRHEVSIWLLHQSRRSTRSRKVIDMDDSADSIEPMRDADMIVTLNQTKAEEADSIMRIFLAGGREARDRRTAKVRFNKELCRVVDLGNVDSEVDDAESETEEEK